MSFDENDFNRTTVQKQHGSQADVFPIVFQPINQQEVEISIPPLDALFLPAVYDASYGVNPMQTAAASGILEGIGLPILPLTVGANPCDVLNQSSGNGQMATSAAIYSIRINNQNNSSLLWTLSTQNPFFTDQNSRQIHAGIMASTRAIIGPIARLWIRLVQYADAYTYPNVPSPATLLAWSQLVMIGTRGITLVHAENEGSSWNPNGDYIQANSNAGTRSFNVGSYKQTTLNTLDRERLGQL